MIQLKNVTKRFGSFTAVDDLSLTVAQGEFFGFLGPNGAGKTTTIKMLTGLFTQTEGSITVGGHDVVSDPMKAKSVVGYIPDQPYLYDKLTGKEYLYFSAGLYHLPHRTVSERVAAVADALEIGSWIDRRAEEYSQGMRQRIAICAALLHDPTVIVVDEPMIGLDPRSAMLVKNTFRKKAEEGVTVFMSTHSLHIAEEVCDTVGIIKNGKLLLKDRIAALHTYGSDGTGRLESLFLQLTE